MLIITNLTNTTNLTRLHLHHINIATHNSLHRHNNLTLRINRLHIRINTTNPSHKRNLNLHTLIKTYQRTFIRRLQRLHRTFNTTHRLNLIRITLTAHRLTRHNRIPTSRTRSILPMFSHPVEYKQLNRHSTNSNRTYNSRNRTNRTSRSGLL